jgi:hypothetical protein
MRDPRARMTRLLDRPRTSLAVYVNRAWRALRTYLAGRSTQIQALSDTYRCGADDVCTTPIGL